MCPAARLFIERGERPAGCRARPHRIGQRPRTLKSKRWRFRLAPEQVSRIDMRAHDLSLEGKTAPIFGVANDH
jgi:hypothetical protein